MSNALRADAAYAYFAKNMREDCWRPVESQTETLMEMFDLDEADIMGAADRAHAASDPGYAFMILGRKYARVRSDVEAL